jgi:hypothetical protein
MRTSSFSGLSEPAAQAPVLMGKALMSAAPVARRRKSRREDSTAGAGQWLSFFISISDRARKNGVDRKLVICNQTPLSGGRTAVGSAHAWLSASTVPRLGKLKTINTKQSVILLY